MNYENYFYHCSEEYISTVDLGLHKDIEEIIDKLPKRKTQSEINQDLFWLFTEKGWAYDSLPKKIPTEPPKELNISKTQLQQIKKNNKRSFCITSSTLNVRWFADFAKLYGDKLVQIEAQFGTVESMFKDFCGFRVASFEKRLALGIEIVLSEPNKYFSHRKSAIAGMAYFEVAKKTLSTIGLDCPIWLIGIKG